MWIPVSVKTRLNTAQLWSENGLDSGINTNSNCQASYAINVQIHDTLVLHEVDYGPHNAKIVVHRNWNTVQDAMSLTHDPRVRTQYICQD